MAYALPVLTLVVWATRIRNIVEQDDWAAAELLVPVGLALLALGALVRPRPVVPWLAVATLAVWAVRVPLVLVRDHGTAFTVVHVVLAAVSIGVAWLSVSSLRRRRVPAAG